MLGEKDHSHAGSNPYWLPIQEVDCSGNQPNGRKTGIRRCRGGTLPPLTRRKPQRIDTSGMLVVAYHPCSISMAPMTRPVAFTFVVLQSVLSMLPAPAALAVTATQNDSDDSAMSGQPMRQRSVSLQCTKGQASATTDMQGRWKVDASNLAFPCLIIVATDAGKALHSMAGRPGAWYVSPLTNAALLQAMPDDFLKRTGRDRESALPAVWQRLQQSFPAIRERLAAARIPVTQDDFFEAEAPLLRQSDSTNPADTIRETEQSNPNHLGAFPAAPVLTGVVLETIRMKMPLHPDPLGPVSGRAPASVETSANRSAKSACPAGLIWLQSTAVTWPDALPANGRTLPVSAYEGLFKALGTRHGGDGKLVFKLPDLRHRAPKGLAYMVCSGVSIKSPVLQ